MARRRGGGTFRSAHGLDPSSRQQPRPCDDRTSRESPAGSKSQSFGGTGCRRDSRRRPRQWTCPTTTPADVPLATITNSIGMKFILIPAGEFLMGLRPTAKGGNDDEQPEHRVRITRPFYLGVHEVTRGQFRRFVDDAGYQTEAEKDGKGGYGWNEEKKTFEQTRSTTGRTPVSSRPTSTRW